MFGGLGSLGGGGGLFGSLFGGGNAAPRPLRECVAPGGALPGVLLG